jgi:hypothetical protein
LYGDLLCSAVVQGNFDAPAVSIFKVDSKHFNFCTHGALTAINFSPAKGLSDRVVDGLTY